MRLVLTLLTMVILTACQPKEMATDGTGTATGHTEPAVGTTMVTCGERVTEAVLTDFESTGTIPEPPCGDDGCGPGEVCVVPGKVCEYYETEGCGNGGIDDPCADDEPGPPPFCASVPPSCIDGSMCDGYCLDQEFCENPGDYDSFADGILKCGPAFNHCP
jgi:hypothetical protein